MQSIITLNIVLYISSIIFYLMISLGTLEIRTKKQSIGEEEFSSYLDTLSFPKNFVKINGLLNFSSSNTASELRGNTMRVVGFIFIVIVFIANIYAMILDFSPTTIAISLIFLAIHVHHLYYSMTIFNKPA